MDSIHVSNLIDEALDWLYRPRDIEARDPLKKMIDLLDADLSLRLRVGEMVKSFIVDLSVNELGEPIDEESISNSILLPDDCVDIYRIETTKSNVSIRPINYANLTDSTLEPSFSVQRTLEGLKVYFSVGVTRQSLTIYYYSRLSLNNNDELKRSVAELIKTVYPDLYLNGLLSLATVYFKEDDRIAFFLQRFNQRIDNLNSEFTDKPVTSAIGIKRFKGR